MGVFTYDKVKNNFSSWNSIGISVFLLVDRLFLVILSSKTDPFCQGVTLIILAASDGSCTIKSLNNLFIRFSRANYQPLFSNHIGSFRRNYITKKLQEKIYILGYKGNYTGHLFKKRVVTSAKLAGLSEEKIQVLRRWKSKCYRLYVETHHDWIYNASQRHQLF